MPKEKGKDYVKDKSPSREANSFDEYVSSLTRWEREDLLVSTIYISTFI